MNKPINVAIIGHSYVSRIERYSRAEESKQNLGFSLDETVIKFFGVSGGSVQRNRRQAICQVLDGPHGVNRFQPEIVFVHLGENDVSRIESSRLLKCYFDFCDQLASINTVRIIVVCELLPFPVVTKNARHSECLSQCNKILKSVSSECMNVDKAYMWKLKIGANGTDAATRVFHADGVHLSARFGMEKYYGRVRSAVGYGLKNLHLL